MTNNDTIVALSTPNGNGAIAIVRLSGPKAFQILSKIWKGAKLDTCKSHTAHLGNIIDPQGKTLDQALVTIFHAPNTFTGENIAEISLHASPWIVNETQRLLINNGARPADHGEFSKRALLNNKIDLAQAEGIADLIAAKSKAAHSLAISQATGQFSSQINSLRQKLIDLSALLELELDFSEEDVEFADRSNLILTAQQILQTLHILKKSFQDGKAFKEGIPVAIIGQPNAGKSSLLNNLLGYDKAIVTDIPGTTRDTIDDTIDINGITFRLFDTAGIRNTSDVVEQLGIQRTQQTIEKARIILHLHPADQQPSYQQDNTTTPTIHLLTKADLISSPHTTSPDTLPISVKTGENIDTLRQRLYDIATAQHNPDQELILTNQRHYHAVIKAAENLQRAIQSIQDGLPADLTAQDLRQTIHHLSLLTGAILPADILSTIFSRFCIGK